MSNLTHYKYLLIISLLAFIANLNHVYSQNYLDKIVIDAGHGGKDPGASGKYSREKDVVLAIALKTGETIKKHYPEVEIIYTRKTDVFIPLKERAEIANKANADLFISIHCNANASSQPHGSETYVMGLHKSEANLNVAKAENAAILFEEDYEQNYEGFDPTSDESHIIFNFFQNSFLAQNLDLASKVQSKFTVLTPLKDRGVKQAGFWVLYKTTMPGVLIETGFLSNPNDEKFLNSKEGQEKLSKAIANAVSEYKKDHDAKEKRKAALSEEEKKTSGEELVNDVPDLLPKNEENSIEKETVSIDLEPSDKKDSPNKDAENNTANSIHPQSQAQTQKATYHVQFLSLSKDKELKGGNYDKMQPISSYNHKGMYRYISGKTESYEEALKLQSKVRDLGFKDAFLVAFFKGNRITLAEARKINHEN
jgi:N-acetylmuramoyl-L-alanine amidase